VPDKGIVLWKVERRVVVCEIGRGVCVVSTRSNLAQKGGHTLRRARAPKQQQQPQGKRVKSPLLYAMRLLDCDATKKNSPVDTGLRCTHCEG